MSTIKNFTKRFNRARYGISTYGEFFLQYIDIFSQKLFGLNTGFNIRRLRHDRLLKTRREGQAYCLKDVRLPALEKGGDCYARIFNLMDSDIFSLYLNADDDYSEKTFDKFEAMLPEGLYGLVNDKVNVTIKAGDIVIDAGSCCGAFSAYASMKGAVSYAFEPVPDNFIYLVKTAKLNKNIFPVNKGLSDENTSQNIFINNERFGSSSFLEELKPGSDAASTQVETVRLDDFVRENNLPRVDFIKCDIEGFERRMLAGAQEVLREFAPKLALCTYHLPDDPKVMADLIRQANPKYNIVQKRMKLFASVPDDR